MDKPFGLALLIGGISLLIVGYYQSQSSFDVSGILTNGSSDRSSWFLVSGGIATIVGFFLFINRAR